MDLLFGKFGHAQGMKSGDRYIFSLPFHHRLSALGVMYGLNVARCVLDGKVTWHFLLNCVSKIILLLHKLLSACPFI